MEKTTHTHTHTIKNVGTAKAYCAEVAQSSVQNYPSRAPINHAGTGLCAGLKIHTGPSHSNQRTDESGFATMKRSVSESHYGALGSGRILLRNKDPGSCKPALPCRHGATTLCDSLHPVHQTNSPTVLHGRLYLQGHEGTYLVFPSERN